MTQTLEQIAAQAMQLPTDSRTELIEQLLASLADEQGQTTNAWRAEATRRAAEVRNGTVIPIPGEDVLAEARRKAGR